MPAKAFLGRFRGLFAMTFSPNRLPVRIGFEDLRYFFRYHITLYPTECFAEGTRPGRQHPLAKSRRRLGRSILLMAPPCVAKSAPQELLSVRRLVTLSPAVQGRPHKGARAPPSLCILVGAPVARLSCALAARCGENRDIAGAMAGRNERRCAVQRPLNRRPLPRSAHRESSGAAAGGANAP